MFIIVAHYFNFILVNLTVQLLSQKVPSDSRALLRSCGKIYACFTTDGRCGILSSALCVKVMCFPSGSLTITESHFPLSVCGGYL